MTEIKTDDDPLGLVDSIISDILTASFEIAIELEKGFQSNYKTD